MSKSQEKLKTELEMECPHRTWLSARNYQVPNEVDIQARIEILGRKKTSASW
jgi:hypothetical protein